MKHKPCPRCGGTGEVPDQRLKLDDGDVAEIRRRARSGQWQKWIAQDWGVSQATISRIVSGKERAAG